MYEKVTGGGILSSKKYQEVELFYKFFRDVYMLEAALNILHKVLFYYSNEYSSNDKEKNTTFLKYMKVSFKFCA